MTEASAALKSAVSQHYRLEREIGAGGMATVWLAEDLKHRRRVAIKVLRHDLTVSLGAERFLREIAITANLMHPHVLPIHDSGGADGLLYFVMPFVEGPSLRQKLLREGALPISDAVRILRDVADAMAHAHKHGVVHRDLKPENVMIADRHALVTDFGVAKALSESTGRQALTTAGVALGTPAYMSPEQATADPHADHRVDIYAFGVMAYELLAGRPPFLGDSPQAVLAAHLTQSADSVDKHRAAIPPALTALVMKCLEKQPADRWQTAEELVPQLEAMLTPSGGTAPLQPAAVGRARPRRLLFLGGGGALLAVAAFAAWLASTRGGLDAKRVAVVPFENRTGTDSLNSFGIIIADVVTNELVRTGLVNVAPTASVLSVSSPRRDGGSRPDPRVIAKGTGAGLIVSGNYFRQGDSIAVQAQIVDVARDRPAAPLDMMVFGAADQRGGLDRVRQQILVALSARLNPRIAEAGALSDLPMSFEAYRKFAEGLERYGAVDYRTALRLFHEARALDTSSASALFMVALTEWNANPNPAGIGRTDSLLRLLEPRRATLQPFDAANYDFLRAWTDGDLEGALRASRKSSELAPSFHTALDAYRANRWDEAWRSIAVGARDSTRRQFVRFWEFYTLVLHQRRDFKRELSAAQQAAREQGERRGFTVYEARALAALGRGDELRARLEALRAQDPADAFLRGAAVELALHGHADLARDFARQAVEAYRSALNRDTTGAVRFRLAGTLYDLGEYDEALREYQAAFARDTTSGATVASFGLIAAARGDTARADSIVDRLATMKRPYIFGAHIRWQARIAARLGQCDRAVAFLAQAQRAGNAFPFEDPELERLRGCRAFERYMEPKK